MKSSNLPKSEPHLTKSEIDITNFLEIRYYYEAFGITEHEFRNAVYLVGNDINEIKKFLNTD